VALVVPEPGICPGTGKPVARTSADGFATTAPGPLPADMPVWHDHTHATAALLEAADLVPVHTGRSSALSRAACGRFPAAVTVPALSRKGGTGR
jgi:hypothetical protein